MISADDSLAYAPELGTLLVLDAALDMAIRTLAALDPQLEELDEREWSTPPTSTEATSAAAVVGLADTLRCALLHYITAIEDEIYYPHS